MNWDLSMAESSAIQRCDNMFVNDKAGNKGFGLLYPFTTENIAGYIDLFDLADKSLLTVGSSGDQVINSILRNVKDVTLLDVNPYAKYYYFLKAAGILEFNLAEFNRFFRYLNYPKIFKTNKYAFNKDGYEKIIKTLRLLDYDSYLFWDELFNSYSSCDIRDSLFSGDEHRSPVIESSNLYLQNESNYIETRQKIKKVRPSFINEDIFNVELNRNFDNIWLSNIACYLYPKEIKKMTDKFTGSLNENGKLLIGYLYEIDMETEYNIDWSPIYDLKGDLRLLNEYAPTFQFFTGVDGIKFSEIGIKDAVLVYQKKIGGSNNGFVKR